LQFYCTYVTILGGYFINKEKRDSKGQFKRQYIFTKEESNIIIEHYIKEKLSLNKIAKIFNCTPGVIRSFIIKNGYSIRNLKEAKKEERVKVNEEYFNIIDNNEKAYWLGFIAADGCIYHKNKKYYTLLLTLQSGDYKHLIKYTEALNYKGNIYSYKNKYSFSETKITSNKLCKKLIELGITERKSLTLKFPNILKEFYSHFIRGYFDGDGSIYLDYSDAKKTKKSPNYIPQGKLTFVGTYDVLSMINKILCSDVLFKVGYKLFQRNVNKNTYQLSIGGNKNIRKIYNYFYSNANMNIWLDRKKEKFDYLINLKSKKRIGRKKYIEIEGVCYTINEWCKIMNICRNTFFKRIKEGKFIAKVC
jgi:hypothetical protein